jgi:hypothetical protein
MTGADDPLDGVSRRSILRSAGLSGAGLAGIGGPLYAVAGGDPDPPGIGYGDAVAPRRILAQNDVDVPDVQGIVSGVIERLDEIRADTDAPGNAPSLPSGLDDLLAARGAAGLLPPTAVTVDLRPIDVDYRVRYLMSKLRFHPPSVCSPPEDVPGIFLAGIGLGLEQHVDTPTVDWETSVATQPWFGYDVHGCTYSGQQVTVDFPPPDGPWGIVPDLDSHSVGFCHVECPRRTVEPVAEAREEIIEAEVRLVETAWEWLQEQLEPVWDRLGPIEAVGLAVLAFVAVVLAAVFVVVAAPIVASVLSLGGASAATAGTAAIAVLIGIAILSSPNMPETPAAGEFDDVDDWVGDVSVS